MNYGHDIYYIQLMINNALLNICSEDKSLRYDKAKLITCGVRPSLSAVQQGLIHSQNLIGIGPEYNNLQNSNIHFEEDNLEEGLEKGLEEELFAVQFCKATLSQTGTRRYFGRKIQLPWTRKECPIFGYESHVMLQPESFSLGHSALEIRETLLRKNIETKIDYSMMR